MSAGASIRRAWRKQLTGYAFVAPWLVGFVIFTLYPFLASIYFSLTRYDIVTAPRFVGLANYRFLAHDAVMWHALLLTFAYALVAVPLGIVAGVGIALLLNLEVRGVGIYRTIFYLPAIVPTVAATLVFIWILNPQIGLVNDLLRVVGIVGPAWLKQPGWTFVSLVVMSLWGVGGSMVVYLAALKDIPFFLYEAAVIDGAGVLSRLRHVTLPLLSPVIFFNLVMGVISAFQYFTQAYMLQNEAAPEEATRFYAVYLFERSWRYLDMGYASAMAWILFLVIVVVTGLVFRTHRKWVHYGS
jgi:multiple sugar transport system permease protein